MKKLPYMAFYTGDWLKDPAVSLCAPATRGVWFDLLCAMHESGRVGSLSGTCEQLARLGRCVPAELALALTDLQTTGAADVAERNGVVTVTCRRMARDANDRASNALRQSRHRGSKSSNGIITPLSHLYEVEDEIEFLSVFPESIQSVEFREVLNDWLRYKNERKENYEPTGLRKMLSHAGKRAAEHGIKAVIDAMERAMGNGWAGWDQSGSFGGKSNGNANVGTPKHVGPGQRYRGD